MPSLVLLVACRSSEGLPPTTAPPISRPPTAETSEDASCGVVAPAEVRLPANPRVRLARVLHLELAAPAEAVLVLDDEPVARFPAATTHDLPLLGLRQGEEHLASVELTCGETVASVGPIVVDPGPGPALPRIDVLANDTARRAPGATLVDLSGGGQHGVVALDPDGVPVWYLGTADRPIATELADDGTLWIVSEGLVRHVDLLGNDLGRYRPADLAGPGDIPVDVSTFHHDVRPVDGGGFVTLGASTVAVDAYPLSTSDPDGPTRPAELLDVVALEIAADGAVVHRYPLADRLDTERIGWLSLDPGPSGFDWVHGNAILVDPADGDLIVSLRHQDALVKLARDTGEVRWILSVADGWREPWSALRLAPVGAFSWPYHAHGATLTDDGHLLMFDNGNNDRTTPYAGVDDGEGYYSRVVEYALDEAGMSVREVWSSARTTTGRLFSEGMGSAEHLSNGNRLGLWGYLSSEADVTNASRGRGTYSVRLVETAPDGTIAWEASLWSEAAAAPTGWHAHQAHRVETWYPASPVD